MKLVKLTHPQENYDLWVDLEDIVVLERKNAPKTTGIVLPDQNKEVTVIVLKSGKTVGCLETPEDIVSMKSGVLLG